MKKLGIVFDSIYIQHNGGVGHPESPDRLLAIVDMLTKTGLSDELTRIEPRDATKEEITLVHKPDYFDRIASTKGKARVRLDSDTSTSPASFDAAVRAAGGMLSAIRSVLEGKVEIAFPLVRPPGHHAERGRAMGFCLFNNIAIGAAHLIRSEGKKRVLIVDWDLHHGNGTQNMFYDTSRVLYFSTHQYPYYPGTGGFSETGIGNGEGYTVNVPLNPGMGDKEYIKIFFEILAPVIEQYDPEIILVSAGFDTYFDDPLGGMKVTPEGFAQMTRFLMDAARENPNSKLIFILEGGYNLEGLQNSVKAMVEEILGKTKTDYPDWESSTRADKAIEHVKNVHSRYWDF